MAPIPDLLSEINGIHVKFLMGIQHQPQYMTNTYCINSSKTKMFYSDIIQNHCLICCNNRKKGSKNGTVLQWFTVQNQ